MKEFNKKPARPAGLGGKTVRSAEDQAKIDQALKNLAKPGFLKSSSAEK